MPFYVGTISMVTRFQPEREQEHHKHTVNFRVLCLWRVYTILQPFLEKVYPKSQIHIFLWPVVLLSLNCLDVSCQAIYPLQKCLPSPECKGTQWHSACGTQSAQTYILEDIHRHCCGTVNLPSIFFLLNHDRQPQQSADGSVDLYSLMLAHLALLS